MSGDARITGQINIVPPVTWGELHDKPHLDERGLGLDGHFPDVTVKLDTISEVTAEGEFLRRSGVAIIPTGFETNGYTLLDEVRRIVAEFATAPDGTARTFAGFLHVVWGRGEEVYRLTVRDGVPVQVNPRIVWPDGARNEDAVA
jgi:hypothetical protein